MNHRLPYEPKKITETSQKIIKQNITPIIKASPFLMMFSGYELSDLNGFFIQTQHKISQHYSDLSYPQIVKILLNKQLDTTINQQIKSKISAINQEITKTYQSEIQRNKQYYKAAYKDYLTHPIKKPHPKKKQYVLPPFDLSENPYTVERFYHYSILTFEALHLKKQCENIRDPHYKLEADHQRERALAELEAHAIQYRNKQNRLKQQSETIQVKKAVLKRKMEQLKHLTRLSEDYYPNSDPVGMSNPEEKIETLRALLNQKRQR